MSNDNDEIPMKLEQFLFWLSGFIEGKRNINDNEMRYLKSALNSIVKAQLHQNIDQQSSDLIKVKSNKLISAKYLEAGMSVLLGEQTLIVGFIQPDVPGYLRIKWQGVSDCYFCSEKQVFQLVPF